MDKQQLAELKKCMAGHTWIAEFVSADKLIDYSDSQLLFHSIVENSTGKVLGDAIPEFKKFGFSCVPCHSHGSLSSMAVMAKVDEIAKQTRSKSLSETHEGVVLQLVDHTSNEVLTSIKVKSNEYEIFATVAELLIDAIEHSEIDTHYDKLVAEFAKELKGISGALPQTKTFYTDLFAQAIKMVSARRSPADYSKHQISL